MKRFKDFSPSGLTQRKSRLPLQGRFYATKALHFASDEEEGGAQPRVAKTPALEWSREEEKLVQFLYEEKTEGAFEDWPGMNDVKLWEAASEFVTEGTDNLRTSKLDYWCMTMYTVYV